MHNTKIIAVAGRARAGKDTVVDMIAAHYGGNVKKLAFANKLKEIIIAELEIPTIEEFNHYKNENIPFKGMNMRTYIQETADRVKKEHGEHYFANALMDDIHAEIYDRNYRVIIVSDLRLLIEEQALSTVDNVITIRVERPNVDNIVESNHNSEYEVDMLPVKHVIVNDGTIDDLNKKLQEIL